MTGATHFDISQLPSLKNGMTADEESKTRRKTCRFIDEAGRVLKLPRVAVSTAMVFFHRFYAKHSFQEHDRFEVAVAALVLAAKTEESPKKLNTVIMDCHKLKTRGMQQAAAAGRSPPSSSHSPPPTPSTSLDPKGEEFSKLKERILLLERVILHTIGFELSIDHPYKFFVEQVKKLVQTRQLKYINPPTPPPGSPSSWMTNKMTNELVQYSLSFANDSMHTSLCLQFSPQLIATACVYLACQFAGVEPTSGNDWSKCLGHPDMDSLASICLQLLELIAEKKSKNSLDIIQKIKTQLELLKSSSSSSDNAGSKSPRPPPPPPPGPPGPPEAKRQRLS